MIKKSLATPCLPWNIHLQSAVTHSKTIFLVEKLRGKNRRRVSALNGAHFYPLMDSCPLNFPSPAFALGFCFGAPRERYE